MPDLKAKYLPQKISFWKQEILCYLIPQKVYYRGLPPPNILFLKSE